MELQPTTVPRAPFFQVDITNITSIFTARLRTFILQRWQETDKERL
jgi:hypothetical protein